MQAAGRPISERQTTSRDAEAVAEAEAEAADSSGGRAHVQQHRTEEAKVMAAQEDRSKVFAGGTERRTRLECDVDRSVRAARERTRRNAARAAAHRHIHQRDLLRTCAPETHEMAGHNTRAPTDFHCTSILRYTIQERRRL